MYIREKKDGPQKHYWTRTNITVGRYIYEGKKYHPAYKKLLSNGGIVGESSCRDRNQKRNVRNEIK